MLKKTIVLLRDWVTRWTGVLLTCIDKSTCRPISGSRHVLKLLLCKKKFLALFLLVNANPIPLDNVIRLYLIYSFLLNIGHGSWPTIGWKKCKFYATLFDHWPLTNLTFYILQSYSKSINFGHWVIILHMLLVMVHKKADTHKLPALFKYICRKLFQIFKHKSKEPLKKLNNHRVTYFRPRSLNFRLLTTKSL